MSIYGSKIQNVKKKKKKKKKKEKKSAAKTLLNIFLTVKTEWPNE